MHFNFSETGLIVRVQKEQDNETIDTICHDTRITMYPVCT